MPEPQTLVPAAELAATNKAHFPNESAAYRAARNRLLTAELELRRSIERVAAERRALPDGGLVPRDYTFTGEQGPVSFSALFGDRQTLMVYSMMFGPQRQRPCPMCTSFLSTWNGTAINLRQQAAIVVTARSPIERILDFRREREWKNLPVVSDSTGDYTRTYVNADDADVPGFSIFTRRDGVIRHFWTGEFSGAMSDPGQDPRGAPDIDLLWTMLDLTPAGRGKDWYPKLAY